ncbi:hypothetical protein M433DRAFT_158928 [Acidomyces richmondensis BFW]|nr:hypothetical protein M433DRAFT_158928 [Acidomyces richmondensis BFW]
MASSAPLKLFPPPHKPQSRKSNLKKQCNASATSTPELKGLAVQVTPRSPPKIRPASDTIKHSLFCEPPDSPRQNVATPKLPRRRHAQRRSSRPESLVLKDSLLTTAFEDDKLTPLPVNTHFASTSPPRRNPSKQFKHPTLPHSTDVEASGVNDKPMNDDDDKLSPLPGKTRFTPVSPRSSEYPTPMSRSISSATIRPLQSQNLPSSSIRSIFPQYDPTKALDQQHYYPTTESLTKGLPSQIVSKSFYSPEKPRLERIDSCVAIVDGYDHIPAAYKADVDAMWNVASGHFTHNARKFKVSLFQKGSALAVGLSADKPLFSMEKAAPQPPVERNKNAKLLSIEKYSPSDHRAALVAHLTLSNRPSSENKDDNKIVSIFPHQAAIHVIEAASNSSAPAEIAAFDPLGVSAEAASFERDAIAHVRRLYGCTLLRAARKRDSLGAVTAAYDLEHPSLGSMAITVTKSFKRREARAKVSIHHPSATPAAVAAESSILAFFDFANDACVVDLPSLMALEKPYIIDTAFAALFAVAAIENDMLLNETVTFAPPPKTPFNEKKSGKKSSARSGEKRRWYRRSSKAIDQAQRELVGQPVDVAAPIQAAVALLGLSLKTAVLVLGTGVKIAVSAIEHLAAKA